MTHVKSFCRKHPQGAFCAVLIFLCLVVLLRAAILNYQYYFGMYHDDGVYLVSAQSLLDGHGYRIASLPSEPFQTKYPVAYPFLLSIFSLLLPAFPGNMIGLEVLQVILSISAVLLTVAYLISTKKITPLLGLVIGSASLLNMRFIDFAPMLMSDLPTAVLVAASMWSAETQCRKVDNYSPWTGLLVAAAITTRSQAVILVPTLLIYFAFRKRFKSMLIMLAITAVCVAPQIWWQSQNNKNTPEILTFYTNYLKHAYGSMPSSDAGFVAARASFSSSLVTQMNTYFPGLEQIPYKKLSPIAFILLYNVFYFLLVIPACTGLLIKLRRTSIPSLYCLFYAISLSIWPINLEWRHILPVLVFAYYFYFIGFRFWSLKLKGALHSGERYTKFCRAAAITFSFYLVVGAAVLSSSKAGWLKALSEPPAPSTAVDFQEAVNWIKANTPADSVFVCNNDPVLYLYTKRHAIMPSRLELWRFITGNFVDPESLRSAIKFSKASYVMNEPVFRSSGYAYTQLNQAVAEEQQRVPGSFTPVFQSKNKLIHVYEIGKSHSLERMPKITSSTHSSFSQRL